MFLLIYTEQDVFPELKVISIHLMLLLIVFWQSWHLPGTNFNTSHVSINLLSWSGAYFQYIHFNTSHVSINRLFVASPTSASFNFNTSHVSINPVVQVNHYSGTEISIHLMFLLIKRYTYFPSVLNYFKTSHVSINRSCHKHSHTLPKFQYISCFY